MKLATRLIPFFVTATVSCLPGLKVRIRAELGVRQKGARPHRLLNGTLKEERCSVTSFWSNSAAKRSAPSVEVQVANGDDAVQTKQCEPFDQGCGCLIVAPHNGQIAASIVEAAHRQGVPVISYDV